MSLSALSAVAAVAATSSFTPFTELPSFQPLDDGLWAHEVARDNRRSVEHTYMTSFDVNSSQFILCGTNGKPQIGDECLVFEVANNAIVDKIFLSPQTVLSEKPLFQKEVKSFLQAVCAQTHDRVVENAYVFSQTVKNIEWRPSVWNEDDEIMFEWVKDDKHAVVSIEDDGTLNYAMLIDNQFIPGAIKGAVVAALPDDLSDYLVLS